MEPPPAKGRQESQSAKLSKLSALRKLKEEGARIDTVYVLLPDENEEGDEFDLIGDARDAIIAGQL